MSEGAIDIYLNDHLAGAMLGSNLAEQIQSHNEGTPLGDLVGSLATKIEEDRQTLIEIMDRLEISKNPVKQATSWVAEKASKPKFGGLTSNDPEFGTFMALETLSLGVEGKASLWKALKDVADDYPALAPVDFDGLVERALAQRSSLEDERMAAARRALGSADAAA